MMHDEDDTKGQIRQRSNTSIDSSTSSLSSDPPSLQEIPSAARGNAVITLLERAERDIAQLPDLAADVMDTLSSVEQNEAEQALDMTNQFFDLTAVCYCSSIFNPTM